MKYKEIYQGIIRTMQEELPFSVLPRDLELPASGGRIITVVGVRRCGKSSMLKLVANRLVAEGISEKRILWINFDDERFIGMQAESLDELLTAYREMYPEISLKDVYMFFDEIQNVEGWELFVLRVYKTYCRNIFVSGSNAKMLSSQLSTALRGWPVEYEVFPLAFDEYIRFRRYDLSVFSETDRSRLKLEVDSYLKESSFPEVVLTDEVSLKIRKVQGYFNTMLFRDLMERYSLKSPEVVRYVLKRIMGNLTKPTSINSIYNDIKSQGLRVDKQRLYQLAEWACEIFMLFKVHRFSRSLIKETAGLPKYYFVDNGMRRAVLLPQSEDKGKMLENAVYLHLRRNLAPMQKITYFHERVECDFVVQQDEYIGLLVQVCWELSDPDTRKRELRGLKVASDYTGCSRCVIVTYDDEDILDYEGLQVEVVPVWKWLLRPLNLSPVEE